jgi:hypothetical protein
MTPRQAAKTKWRVQVAHRRHRLHEVSAESAQGPVRPDPGRPRDCCARRTIFVRAGAALRFAPCPDPPGESSLRVNGLRWENRTVFLFLFSERGAGVSGRGGSGSRLLSACPARAEPRPSGRRCRCHWVSPREKTLNRDGFSCPPLRVDYVLTCRALPRWRGGDAPRGQSRRPGRGHCRPADSGLLPRVGPYTFPLLVGVGETRGQEREGFARFGLRLLSGVAYLDTPLLRPSGRAKAPLRRHWGKVQRTTSPLS